MKQNQKLALTYSKDEASFLYSTLLELSEFNNLEIKGQEELANDLLKKWNWDDLPTELQDTNLAFVFKLITHASEGAKKKAFAEALRLLEDHYAKQGKLKRQKPEIRRSSEKKKEPKKINIFTPRRIHP